jgi:7-keto-8-aminopelargonate synthetase-like enzyme
VDLEQKLKKVIDADMASKKKKALNRRFIVFEGLYANYGGEYSLPFCPLPCLLTY